MGRTYTVPRSVKGESRILYIFSVKSFLFTLGFGLVGILLYFLFAALKLNIVGYVVIGVFAIIGFIIGSLKIPDTPIVGNLRKAGGEQISDIIFRALTFRKRKKIYLYREDDK